MMMNPTFTELHNAIKEIEILEKILEPFPDLTEQEVKDAQVCALN